MARIYQHVWNAHRGWHRQVIDIPEFGEQTWEHPKKRKMVSEIFFTVNYEMWEHLQNSSSEERLTIFQTEYEYSNQCDKFHVLKVRKQHDPIISWTDELELKFYIGSQLTDAERFLWRRQNEQGNEKISRLLREKNK